MFAKIKLLNISKFLEVFWTIHKDEDLSGMFYGLAKKDTEGTYISTNDGGGATAENLEQQYRNVKMESVNI